MARRRRRQPTLARWQNPFANNNPIKNAGNTATHVAGGRGGKGGGYGAASSGVGSVAGGVGHATGTSGSGYSSASSGVSSITAGVSQGKPPPAPHPVFYNPADSHTTVDLKPLVSSISDPAVRALAPAAIRAGLRYEVNPSVLLASADVTDYGRKGQGKGYANLGDGSEDGAKSIQQAARYLSEVGFHDNPRAAIAKLAKQTGANPAGLRKTAAGYTELDQAVRNIQAVPGDTQARGVGRLPHKVARAAAAGVAAGGVASTRAGGGREFDSARAVAEGQDSMQQPLSKAERRARQATVNALRSATQGGLAYDRSPTGAVGRAVAQSAGQVAGAARGTVAGTTRGRPPQAQGSGAFAAGPRPRKVARRLERASNRATPEITGLSDPNQAAFAAALAKETGLSPRVVAAWVRQEGGNLTPGDNNWLNIGAFDSGFDRGIMGDPRFRDPAAAAKLTADFLRGKAFGASAGIQAILPNAVGKSDQQQIAAIAGSGWATDPNYAANIGRNYSEISASPGRDIPKRLLQTGYDVLGREATKAILNGGKLVRAPKGGVKETRFSGRYAGSQDVVRYLVGTKVKGDHGGTKNGEAPGVHTPDGDHYRADGYAQDINGTSPGENEPAYDQSTLDTIVKNLRNAGAQPPPSDLKIGENWEGTLGKYSVQVLTNEGGTINHIHVGAHPTDGSGGGAAPSQLIPIKGTKLAVQPPPPPPSGTAGGFGSTSSGAPLTAQSGASSLAGAIGAASKERGISIPAGIIPRSSAAAYARAALAGATTADGASPLDRFRSSEDPYVNSRFRPRRRS